MRITNPMNCTVYAVETNERGEKQIHLLAYTFDRSGANETDETNRWAIVEGTFCYVSLNELQAGEVSDVVDDAWSATKQYQEDCSTSRLIDYLDGWEIKDNLPISEVTDDTPDGVYVEIEQEFEIAPVKESGKKYKLTVVYGTEACRYADGRGVEKTVQMIESGKLEGSYSTYELDTEADVAVLKKALNDSCGWDASFWSDENDTFEYNKDEKDLVEMVKKGLVNYGLETGQYDVSWLPINAEVETINGDYVEVFQISTTAVKSMSGEDYELGEIENLYDLQVAVAEEWDIEMPES